MMRSHPGRQCGCVAQLARACGSYPQCQRFDSTHSHHILPGFPVRAGEDTRPDGQEVKTPPFHGGITGSIPVRVTIFGHVAQLVRAPASHAGGRWFESIRAHQKNPHTLLGVWIFFFWRPRRRRKSWTSPQANVHESQSHGWCLVF